MFGLIFGCFCAIMCRYTYIWRMIMIITFCGHRDFLATSVLEARLLTIMEELIGDDPAELYLGGYGNFDTFAYHCGCIYRKLHPQVSLVFVTPYITPLHADGAAIHDQRQYDEILYPALERVPPKYAISHRNRYMVEHADLVIAYITHSRGGAYQTYCHAKRKGKVIYNLADYSID